MAAADHWSCVDPKHERHALTRNCQVSIGHDPSQPPYHCYTCKRDAQAKFQPPKRHRDYSADMHYDCALLPWEHETKVTGATGGHRLGCPTQPGHSGRPNGACYECRMRYQGNDGPLLGKYAEHPHFACALTPDEHPLMRGFGKGHRQGCLVAEGHDEGWVKGCRKCQSSPAIRKQIRYFGLKKRHGITKDDYEEMLANQGGVCGICHKPPPEGQYLHVDHDHKTGRIRGLLCRQCNIGLGNLGDDASLIDKISEYLTH